VLVTLAAVAVFVIADLSAQETRARQRSALVAGLLVGGLFVLLLRAPSASTRPKFTLGEASTLTSEPVAPSAAADSADPVAAVEHHLVLATAEPLFTGPTLRVSLADELVIEHSDRTLRVNPVLQIDSASAHCLWSIIDYENETPEPWRVAQIGAQSWLIATESRSVSNRTRLTIEGERVTLNVSNTVEREVCVHLAQLLTVSFPRRSDDSAQLEVAGHTLHAGPVREALAWRHGEFALLRAEQDEKGPFETLALLPDPDPAFNADGLKFQVAGFAEQASHEASPTAGWGVSQGAIEVVGRSLFWELAATSIGRGWSTVRISPGTYELTLTLEPAP
jgi:hypothetical protein